MLPIASTDDAGVNEPKREKVLAGAGTALTLLLAINLFNYIDRNVLAAVEPEISAQLFDLSGLGICTSDDPQGVKIYFVKPNEGGAKAGLQPNDVVLTVAGEKTRDIEDLINAVKDQDVGKTIDLKIKRGDQEIALVATLGPRWPEWVVGLLMGLLGTAFIVAFMCLAPVFARWADYMSRWWIVGIGVILWSLASAASGIPWSTNIILAYALLLCTRLFVGVGEGAYGPVAPTMLSDLYPVSWRGKVMTWFYLAIPIGGAIGYGVGAWVVENPAFGDHAQRWRWAFYLVLPPGMLLGLLCFFMREPPRGQTDAVVISGVRKASWNDYVYLMRNPSFALNTVGMTAMNFGLGGLAFWMARYLKVEAYKPSQGLPEGLNPRMMFGIVTAVAGLVGTLAGGILGDRLRGRLPGAYFVVSGIAMIIGFPSILLFLNSPYPLAWVFGFMTVFCMFFGMGPTNAILANVTHPSLRATGFALNIFIIHAFGDAISPPVLGAIAGLTNMTTAFVVVSITMVIGGLLWIWGAKYLDEDTLRAPTQLPELQTDGDMAKVG